MSRQARWCRVAVCGCILLGNAHAFAQVAAEPTARTASDPKVAAEALFEDGVALSEQGQWADACKKFEASEALDVAVGTLLRLADCYERVGRLASAWARFREARSLAQTQGMPDREGIATLRAAALDEKVARVLVSVPALPPAGFQVDLGETPVPRASWGSAFPLDSGNLVVEARAPGYVTFRRTITIPPSPGARLTVAIPPLEPERSTPVTPRSSNAKKRPLTLPPPAPRREPDSGYTARALGVTFAVVGGVGLATGGALAILSSQRNEESLAECPNSPRLCTPQGVQLREEATTLADTATISSAVGGGLLATGVVVYLVGANKRSSEQGTLTVLPEVSLSSITVRARRTF